MRPNHDCLDRGEKSILGFADMQKTYLCLVLNLSPLFASSFHKKAKTKLFKHVSPREAVLSFCWEATRLKLDRTADG